MESLVDILVPLGFMAAVVTSIYLFLSYPHKERIRMIEIGLAPPPSKGGLIGMSSLWMGLVAVAVGTALLLSQIFAYSKDHLAAAVVFIFIGAGLMVYYRITTPRREEEIRIREIYHAELSRQMETLHPKSIRTDDA